jgi:hypothetical protein
MLLVNAILPFISVDVWHRHLPNQHSCFDHWLLLALLLATAWQTQTYNYWQRQGMTKQDIHLYNIKSTLLLKIKCSGTTIYMKTHCLQTNETQHYCRKENAWEVGLGRKRVELIKSLITWDRKDVLEAHL